MPNRPSIPWKDWISWIALIMLAAEIVVLTLYYPVSRAGASDAIGPVVIGTVALLVGTAQWFWMRSRMNISFGGFPQTFSVGIWPPDACISIP